MGQPAGRQLIDAHAESTVPLAALQCTAVHQHDGRYLYGPDKSRSVALQRGGHTALRVTGHVRHSVSHVYYI